MKPVFYFISVLILIFSCTSNVEKPKNLLDENKMAAILSDVYIHQQSTYLTEINEKNSNFSKVDAQILFNHQTNPKDFEASYRYYYLHPELYNEILMEVRDRLEEKLPEKDREKRIKEREEKDKKK